MGATLTRPGLLCLESAKKMYAEYANLVALLPAVAAEEEGEERRIPWLATSYVSHSIIALKPDEAFDRLSTQEVGFREGLQMIRENPQTPVLTAEVFPETQRELRDAGYVFEPFSGTMLGVICKSGQLDERITCLEKEAVLDLPLVMYSGKPFAAFALECFGERLPQSVLSKISSYVSIIDFVRTQGVYGLFDSLTYDLLVSRNAQMAEGIRFVPVAGKSARYHVGFIRCADRPLPDEHKRIVNSSLAAYAAIDPERLQA